MRMEKSNFTLKSFVCAAICSCGGDVVSWNSVKSQDGRGTPGSPNGSSGGTGGGSGVGPSMGGAMPTSESMDPGFVLNTSDLKMLPYGVLLNKLATVAGVGKDDALLSDIVSNRLEFADSDYANGVAPNAAWTSAKITLWVRSLKRLCSAPAFQQRTKLPEQLEAFVLKAYGRRAVPQDTADLNAAFAGLSAEESALMACLTLLSSAEFVTR